MQLAKLDRMINIWKILVETFKKGSNPLRIITNFHPVSPFSSLFWLNRWKFPFTAAAPKALLKHLGTTKMMTLEQWALKLLLRICCISHVTSVKYPTKTSNTCLMAHDLRILCFLGKFTENWKDQSSQLWTENRQYNSPNRQNAVILVIRIRQF